MHGKKTGFRLLILALATLAWAALGRATDPSSASPSATLAYHARIPLGSESFSVTPWNSVLTVMVSAENPAFEGWRRETRGRRMRLLTSAGHRVHFYPRHMDFRITLGTRTRLLDPEPFPLRANLSENDYLLQVRFQLKIFHGLRQTVIPASAVTMIGVPAEIPSNERIYRAAFDLGEISLNDRVVLEVLAPGGERLCKFHLDLD